MESHPSRAGGGARENRSISRLLFCRFLVSVFYDHFYLCVARVSQS